jgi:tungstate transport system substrate-binding protein
MKRKQLNLCVILVFLGLILTFTGCTSSNQTSKPNENGEIILATTTSTRDSGLLDVILPDFEDETGISVKVVAVGTGKALEMGKNGEADILLVHAKTQEENFVKDGYGLERFDVMYNDFIILGPNNDPAEIQATTPNNAVTAFKAISIIPETFVSRDDKSGTNTKERAIWSEATIEPQGNWYIKTGSGMGETLTVTNEKQGYTLSDRATYINMKDTLDLEIVCQGDPILFNQYGVIAVNPTINDLINADGAQLFKNWILSPKTQELIGSYKLNGDQLFNPNATK